MPQNQPRKFEVREAALRRRLLFFLEHPTSQQIDGLAKALYLEKRDAYRLALQREAAKWGATAYGQLDPFVDAEIYQDASNMAQKITSTYLKDRASALDAGKDMRQWASDRADWKAKQILQYEYGKSDYKATRDFYTRNAELLPKKEDGSLAVYARVEPREAAVPDECQDWIDAGDVSLDEMLSQDFPAHQHCFLAGTIVAGPSVHIAFARPYEGPIVTIRTARGYELSGTPNHPVLTSEGWIALGQLKEGDNLFSCVDTERMLLLMNPNEHQVPTLIEKICSTFSVPFVQMPSSSADFHGDGIANSYVDVIFPNSSLQKNIGNLLVERLKKLKLTITSQFFIALSSQGAFTQRILRRACPANSVMCRISRFINITKSNTSFSQSSTKRSLRHTGLPGQLSNGFAVDIARDQSIQVVNNKSGTTPPSFNSHFTQPSSENFVIDPNLLRQRISSFSSLVTEDEVVEIIRGVNTTHVYNAATSEGWYLANNIIVSNCPHFWDIIRGDAELDSSIPPEEPVDPSLDMPSEGASDLSTNLSTDMSTNLTTPDEITANDFLSQLVGHDDVSPSNTTLLRPPKTKAEKKDSFLSGNDFLSALSNFQSQINPPPTKTIDTIAKADTSLTPGDVLSIKDQIKNFLLQMWIAGMELIRHQETP